MARVTLRVSDDLAEKIKAEASKLNLSVNAYINFVLKSARDPDFGGSEAERIRERLHRAGLLE